MSPTEVITAGEFRKRLVELCSRSGLSGLPRKRRDRHILLKGVSLTLDKTREYSESEINHQLRSWLRDVGSSIGLDHVELRRHLVDNEYVGRSKDGSRYWVAVSSRQQMVFEGEIEDVNVPLLVEQGRGIIQERKQTYLSTNET